MSKLQVDSVDEVTSANGVTVDGLNIKDSKLTTANSVVTTNITDVNVTEGKIADNAITLAKMASGTDGNIISYDASGNPVAVATGSAAQVLTSAGAGAPPTFATATVPDDAITLAKMAPGTDGNIISYDASGNPVAVATGSAAQVLTSAGAGAPPTFANATVPDDAITLAKMAPGTDGNIISYDTSGNPVAVATGSSGQVLTSAGAGAVPSFQASAVGGKVIQYKHDYDSASIGLSNTSWTDTNLSIAFTPTSASNRIVIKGFVQCYIDGASNSHGSMQYKVLNGSSDVMEANTNLTGYGGNEAFFNGNLPFNVYETTAGNTNARTYKVQVRNESSSAGAHYNQYAGYSALEIWEITY